MIPPVSDQVEDVKGPVPLTLVMLILGLESSGSLVTTAKPRFDLTGMSLL